jgi:hypothetical protein
MNKIKRASEVDYERAKKRALARLKKGFNLGFVKPKSRDELHDREKLRTELEFRPNSSLDDKPVAE